MSMITLAVLQYFWLTAYHVLYVVVASFSRLSASSSWPFLHHSCPLMQPSAALICLEGNNGIAQQHSSSCSSSTGSSRDRHCTAGVDDGSVPNTGVGAAAAEISADQLLELLPPQGTILSPSAACWITSSSLERRTSSRTDAGRSASSSYSMDGGGNKGGVGVPSLSEAAGGARGSHRLAVSWGSQVTFFDWGNQGEYPSISRVNQQIVPGSAKFVSTCFMDAGWLMVPGDANTFGRRMHEADVQPIQWHRDNVLLHTADFTPFLQ